MIKTVIFDIGNVLAGFPWKEFLQKKGFDENTTERIADATVRSDDWKEYDRGCLSDEEMLGLFIKNDPEIEAEIRMAFADMKDMVVRYDYAIPWIQELKAKGLQVLVLSNFSQKALRECWNALDFLPWTDGGILSFREKLIKPMPEVYQLLLDRYRLKAEECVFMDDIQRNVDAAKAVGIRAFRFESREQAVSELVKLGV